MLRAAGPISVEESSASPRNRRRITEPPPPITPVETLLRRACFLQSSDREILEMALGRHCGCRQLARLLGVPAGTVSRRINRLSERLRSRLAAALIDYPINLPEDYRQLGIEYFVAGLSVRELADLHRMTRPQVTRALEYIRAWYALHLQTTKGRTFLS